MPTTPRHPVADHATFRDLNIFEERLRDTAASLQRRKSRYQLFLAQLLVIIALLLIEVFLPPRSSIISVPYKNFLVWLLPEVYTDDIDVTLHPYFTTGLLFVSVTTLVLFFASGMYTEKIAYANKYVPHTNRSLRAFNIYFNTRKPPLQSKLYSNPLSFFFPRPEETKLSRSPSPQPREPPTSGRPRSSSTSRPIPSIPPATNPRGELIFSSRVDKLFREGYERYRSTFQKRRQEAIQHHKDQKWMERWGWLYKLRFWAPPPPPSGPSPGLPTAAGFGRSASTSSSRGRGAGLSRSGTPPTPGSSGSTTARQRDRSGSPMPRQRLSTRRSPNRRVTADGTEKSNRRETGDERDMRMRTLERSLVQGSPSQ